MDMGCSKAVVTTPFRWLPPARLGVLIGLLLTCLAPLCLPAADEKGELGQKELELEQLRGRIESLQSDLVDRELRQSELMEELRSTEQRLGQSARRLRVLKDRLEQQREKLAELQAQRRSKLAELDLQRAALGRQLRAAYAMGRQERVKILLNQQDPAMVSRMMVYYDYFNRARTRQMEQINEVMEALDRMSEEIGLEEQRLKALQTRELEETESLAEVRVLRQQVLTALGSDIRNKDEELKGLKKSEGRLQKLIEQLQDAWIDQAMDVEVSTPFETRKGKLHWPAKGRLTARFGTRKAGNLKWDGVVIAAPDGLEVRAVHHGRVAFADWLQGFGLLLIIDHGNGYLSLYGHNQSLFKDTGDWVEQGEPVASVGRSGGNSSSGVYFGIRHKGKAVNPRSWCVNGKGNRVGNQFNSDPKIGFALVVNNI